MVAGLPKTQQGGLPLRRRDSWPHFLVGLSLIGICSFVRSSQLDSIAPSSPVVSLLLGSAADLNPLAPSSVTSPATHGTPIICFGDSLTQGVGASPGHDYPSLLSKALGTEVVNAGQDGDETEDALRRLETDVLAKNPGLVVVELGANDFLDGRSLKQAFANLEEIVRRVESRGATVVLVGVAPGPLGDLVQKDYDRIVQRYHVAFVPKVLDDIITDPEFKSNDRLHPNDRGYAIMAERIRRAVEPLLKQHLVSGIN